MFRFRALSFARVVSQQALALAVLLLSASAVGVVSAQDNGEALGERFVDGKAAASWAATFQPPGVNGPVYATAQIGDLVYVGGATLRKRAAFRHTTWRHGIRRRGSGSP